MAVSHTRPFGLNEAQSTKRYADDSSVTVRFILPPIAAAFRLKSPMHIHFEMFLKKVLILAAVRPLIPTPEIIPQQIGDFSFVFFNINVA